MSRNFAIRNRTVSARLPRRQEYLPAADLDDHEVPVQISEGGTDSEKQADVRRASRPSGADIDSPSFEYAPSPDMAYRLRDDPRPRTGRYSGATGLPESAARGESAGGEEDRPRLAAMAVSRPSA